MTRSRLRRGIALGITVMVAAAVGFGILELGLRAAGFAPWGNAPLPYVPLMQEPDPKLGWRNLSGRYVFGNSEAIEMTFWPGGLRATGPEPLARERQVLVLGGSFTQGWAVSDAETYAYRLQEAFPGVEVRNLGTAGYGTLQALLSLERALEAAPRAPALVLYGFNDFHDTRNVATAQWLRMLSRVSQLGTVRTPYASLDADGGLIRHPPVRYPDWPLKRRLAAVALLEEWLTEVSGIARSQSAVAVTEALLLERIGSPKAPFTPLDVHDVYSRGEIRDLDGRPGPVSGRIASIRLARRRPLFAAQLQIPT